MPVLIGVTRRTTAETATTRESCMVDIPNKTRSNHPRPNAGHASRRHPESVRRAAREIENAIMGEGAAIIDGHVHAAAGHHIFDVQARTERQAAVGGGHSIGIKAGAAGDAMPLEIEGRASGEFVAAVFAR
jgi:hypothetical protein